MARKISINFRDLETIEVDAGTTLQEIAKHFKHYFNYPILVGKVDNHITSLNEIITRSAKIDLYDLSTGLGNEVYGRTCQFLLVVAVKKLFGDDANLVIEYSIDKGFYCEIEGVKFDKPLLNLSLIHI